MSKCTYGTGSFVLTNTGSTPVRSDAGLLTTVAWDIGDGLVYALEGSIFVTGAAVQWLRDGLGLIDSAAEIEGLARTVPDSGDVVFVPALTGMGAPHWDPHARGAIVGITRGTTRAHLARATLEAISFEVRDVVDIMVDEAGLEVPELSADGGASANDLLLQLQADQLGVPVRRRVVTETTALGAAFLAGLGTGVWGSTDELAQTWALDRRFEPEPGRRDDGRHDRWRDALPRAAPGPAGPAAGRTALCARRSGAQAAGLFLAWAPTEFLPNSWPFSAAMSRSSCGTRFGRHLHRHLLGQGAGDHLPERRDDPHRAGHEHAAAAGLQVLHQRLRRRPRPRCRRPAGRAAACGSRRTWAAPPRCRGPGRCRSRSGGRWPRSPRGARPRAGARRRTARGRPWPRSRRSCPAAR